MKVNDLNTTGAASTGIERTQDTQKPEQGGGNRTGGAESSDRVELSSALGGLARAVSAEGAQRGSRVQQLATAYQNGTYQADPAAISRAMVADATGSGSGKV
jgi:anti-sigma28 factor (negative regulator of flagellin synthesis)